MSASKAPFPDRETIAEKFNTLDEANTSWLKLILENPAQDDIFLEGLIFYLNKAAEARFLNSLKISKAGEWLGDNAPARLQIRLMEIARSSQHAAFASFREGLIKAGGLDKAFPKATI